MLYFKLALSDIKQNKLSYWPFFWAITVLTVINLIFQLLTLNLGNDSLLGGDSVQRMLSFGTQIIFLLTIIIALYVHNFIMRQRKKQLSLYYVIGLEQKHLSFISILEDSLAQLTSLLSGIVISLLLSKVVFLILAKLTDLGINYKFSLTTKAFANVIELFIVLLLVFCVIDVLSIHHLNPLTMANENIEGEPKSNWVIGILSLATLISGYYLALSIKAPLAGISRFFIAVVLVIIGTYTLFIAGSIVLLKMLKKRKKYFYQPTHFITISGLLSRMKENATGLASICILLTMAILTAIVTFSIYLGINDYVHQSTPYDAMIVDQIQKRSPAEARKTIEPTLTKNNVQIKKQVNMKMTTPDAFEVIGNTLKPNLRKANTTIAVITAHDYDKIQGTKTHLKNNQLLVQSDKQAKMPQERIIISNHVYEIKQKINNFKFAFNYQNTVLPPTWIVVSSWKQAKDFSNEEALLASGFKLKGTSKDQLEAGEKLTKDLSYSVFHSQVETKKSLNSIYGSILFLGIILSSTFIVATALIIYYKQLTEGYSDQRRFKILQNVGLSRKEVKKTIHSQILLIFFSPLILATIHLAFALPTINKLLKSMALISNTTSFIIIACGVIGVFAFVYLISYWLTSNVYYRLVEQKN